MQLTQGNIRGTSREAGHEQGPRRGSLAGRLDDGTFHPDSAEPGAVTIPAALSGERVDRVVALLSGHTRAQVAKLIASGGVRLTGVTVSAGSRRVKLGDQLETDLEQLAGTLRRGRIRPHRGKCPSASSTRTRP